MSKLLRCYFASPYGFAESTRDWYYNTYLPRFQGLVEIVDPWTVPLSGPPSREAFLRMGSHHFATIRTCDLVVAALDHEPPDNGTVAEVSFAYALGIPVIGYRNDMRTSGEVGMNYNLMVTAAILGSGGFEATNLDDLLVALPTFLDELSAFTEPRVHA